MKKILFLLFLIPLAVFGQITTKRPIGGRATISGGGYVVERTFYFSCLNEFAGNITESGYTWNSLKPTNTQITTANGFVYTSALTETGASSTVSVTNTTAFNGATASEANYTESPPVYPVAAVNGAFLFSSPSTLRIGGLTDGKYYVFGFLPVTQNANANTSVTIQGTTISKLATNNYPPTGSDRLNNSNLIVIANKQSVGGVIDITFDRTGFFTAPINLFFIQESSTPKP